MKTRIVIHENYIGLETYTPQYATSTGNWHSMETVDTLQKARDIIDRFRNDTKVKYITYP